MKNHPHPKNYIPCSTFDVRRSTRFCLRVLPITGTRVFFRRTSNVERRTNALRAFTLIELLTVMAIMILLAGIGVGTMSIAMRKAAESRARAEIRAMETALEAYKAEQGAYPPLDNTAFQGYSAVTSATNSIGTNWTGNPTVANETTGSAYNNDGWLNSYFVYRALGPTNAGAATKKYMQFNPKNLLTITNTQSGVATVYTVVLDPWKNPYGYNPLAPVANPNSFDLFSAGIHGSNAYPNNLNYQDVIDNWQK